MISITDFLKSKYPNGCYNKISIGTVQNLMTEYFGVYSENIVYRIRQIKAEVNKCEIPKQPEPTLLPYQEAFVPWLQKNPILELPVGLGKTGTPIPKLTSILDGLVFCNMDKYQFNDNPYVIVRNKIHGWLGVLTDEGIIQASSKGCNVVRIIRKKDKESLQTKDNLQFTYATKEQYDIVLGVDTKTHQTLRIYFSSQFETVTLPNYFPKLKVGDIIYIKRFDNFYVVTQHSEGFIDLALYMKIDDLNNLLYQQPDGCRFKYDIYNTNVLDLKLCCSQLSARGMAFYHSEGKV